MTVNERIKRLKAQIERAYQNSVSTIPKDPLTLPTVPLEEVYIKQEHVEEDTEKPQIKVEPEDEEEDSAFAPNDSTIHRSEKELVITKQGFDSVEEQNNQPKSSAETKEIYAKCGLCKYRVQSKNFVSHLKSKFCVARRSCNFCGKICANSDELQIHLREMHEVSSCNICNVVCQGLDLSSHRKARQHLLKLRELNGDDQVSLEVEEVQQKRKKQNEQGEIERKVKRGSFHCPLCMLSKEVINSVTAFYDHLREAHAEQMEQDPDQLLTCLFCKKQVMVKDLCKHPFENSCISRRFCYYCNKKVQDWTELQQHLKSLHKVYVCNQCDIICGSYKVYLAHLHSKSHSVKMENGMTLEKRDAKKQCPICPIGTRVSHLQFHLRLVHGGLLKDPEQIIECVE